MKLSSNPPTADKDQNSKLRSDYLVLKRLMLIVLVAFLFVFYFHGSTQLMKDEQEAISFEFLEHKVRQFARKYDQEDAIVVSKKHHLLYYVRNGQVVTNEKWGHFTYNFPVKVALASRWYHTPEGEMYVDGKNPYSRFVLFLSLSTPGAYGIHSAPTRYRSYMEKMELKDPNFEFATKKDNTRGCVQVENRIIQYLYAKVDVKTPVLVLP